MYGQQAIPMVVRVPATSHPPIPHGLVEAAAWGPDAGAPSPTHPVIRWGGYTYWVYNVVARNGIGIVAYDEAANVVGQWEKPGASHIWQITVEADSQRVIFWGQSNYRVVMRWHELSIPPLAVPAPATTFHFAN
ncbi:hypothetical protein GTO89_11625 [Heliobacterium gestii]|uniref:Uncharacterized protein n=1 Tax=Heliomicrobium gestii TaxID=2699 RepID=A0A845LDR1_HELGE|nr:hypothetical protein [Heliomicrobium gestii]MBM7867427.1 hypothetical protein [Heliomicrobium gestii]MZP43691.1 hypothetical protein [Heliomicrobium gestii]